MNLLFNEYGDCILAVVSSIFAIVIFSQVFSVIGGFVQISIKGFLG